MIVIKFFLITTKPNKKSSELPVQIRLIENDEKTTKKAIVPARMKKGK